MKALLLIAIITFTYAKNMEKVKKLKNRYGFYKDMENEPDFRRVFGGEAANLSEYPSTAILLDRFWGTRCSGSVITSFWVLTAAHCVTSRLAYVKYNSRHPKGADGDTSPVLYLYRHPYYKVVQEDEGRGMDVTLLHHDLGLIRTRDEMVLKGPIQPISAMLQYNPSDLNKEELTILGFGRTDLKYDAIGADQELFAVKLQMVFCERAAWFHCICGLPFPGHGLRGVCSGDSGGPVMYRSVQVGVTSMGPLECASPRSQLEDVTSVFTATFHYVDIINATINDADRQIEYERKENIRKKANEVGRYVETKSAAIIFRFHIPVISFSIFAIVL